MTAERTGKGRRPEEPGQPGAAAPAADAGAPAAHEEGVLETIEHVLDDVLRLPDVPDSRWHRAGFTGRRERIFERVTVVVLLLLVIGWAWSLSATVAHPEALASGGAAARPSVGARITSAITTPGTPRVAYLTDAAVAALTPLRGESGRLRARFQTRGTPLPVDSLPAGTSVELAKPGDTVAVVGEDVPASAPGAAPGIWSVVVRAGSIVREATDINVITLVPSSARRNGRIGLYYIGNWPTEKGRSAARGNYAPPPGFIEVTPANQDTRVSEHFRLRHFLTKDQRNVWPKYLVLEARLLDKLELVLRDLQSRGIDTRGVVVMSGFRTPQYNAGGGNTKGRASLSRHMYGDAADIYIDNDGNGTMDDLNRDGRVTTADVAVIMAAVDRVERAHPALVGGAGSYSYGPGHGPFIHIDTRGYRARWTGTGD